MALENNVYDSCELQESVNPYPYLEIPASKDSIGEIKISTRKAIAETQVTTKGQTSVILSEEVIRKTELLKNAICEYFQIDEEKLFEKTRKPPIAQKRQIYMYLLKKLEPDLGWSAIADLTDKRDHSTIIYAYYKIAELYKTDEETKTDIDNILTLYKTGEKPERLANEEVKIDVDAILTFYKKTLKKSGLPVETQTIHLTAKPKKIPQIKRDAEIKTIKFLTLKQIQKEMLIWWNEYQSVRYFLRRIEHPGGLTGLEKEWEKFLNEWDNEKSKQKIHGENGHEAECDLERISNIKGLLDYMLSGKRRNEVLAELEAVLGKDYSIESASQTLVKILSKASTTEEKETPHLGLESRYERKVLCISDKGSLNRNEEYRDWKKTITHYATVSRMILDILGAGDSGLGLTAEEILEKVKKINKLFFRYNRLDIIQRALNRLVKITMFGKFRVIEKENRYEIIKQDEAKNREAHQGKEINIVKIKPEISEPSNKDKVYEIINAYCDENLSPEEIEIKIPRFARKFLDIAEKHPGISKDNFINQMEAMLPDFLREDILDELYQMLNPATPDKKQRSKVKVLKGIKESPSTKNLLHDEYAAYIRAQMLNHKILPKEEIDHLRRQAGPIGENVTEKDITNWEPINRIMRHNLRLVDSVAKQYNSQNHLKEDDLFNEGCIGLRKGTIKYNPDRGTEFSTYATWWIRHDIKSAIANQNRDIRYPIHHYELIKKIERFKERFCSLHDHQPDNKEIAEKLRIPIKRLEEIPFKAGEEMSFETIKQDNEENKIRPYEESIGEDDKKYKAIEEENYWNKFISRAEEIILNQIFFNPRKTAAKERDSYILKRRYISLYGIQNPDMKIEDAVLREIGDEVGLVRERIRQVCNKLIEMLRLSPKMKEFWIE